MARGEGGWQENLPPVGGGGIRKFAGGIFLLGGENLRIDFDDLKLFLR